MKLPSLLAQNPIIVHSLRNRRWNWRMLAALGLAILAYCPASLIVLTGVISDVSALLYDDWAEIARVIFYASAIVLLLLVTLFAPTMAASAIAGERQRQTLDLLLVTLLPPRSIVIGKLVSALTYTLVLIGLTWPLILITLLLGGVALIELIVTILLLLVTSVAFTVIGLYGSSLSQTTTNATMLTYGVFVPGFLIGPFLAMLPVTIVLNLIDVTFRLEEIINFYGWSLAASLNPLSAAIYSAILREQEGGFILTAQPEYLLFPWIIYIIFYTFVTWLLARFTIRRLERLGGR